MFCHNCGKDCGEFKFCPYCGVQVQQTQENGLKCEFCDSIIKIAPDSGVCPNCGGFLTEQEVVKESTLKNLKFPEPPIGTYDDALGFVKIQKDSVVFYRRYFPKDKACVEVPFSDIYAAYHLPAGFLRLGVICIRQWENRHIPPDRDYTTDNTLVCFGEQEEEKFMPVYLFLKECSDIVNKAREMQDRST